MVYELKKPEDELIAGKEGEGVSQPELLGQKQTLETGSVSAPTTAPVKTTKQPVSGVADIGSYLEANRQKARELAGKIGGVITGEVGKAQTGLGATQEQFLKDVAAGTAQKDQELFERGRQMLTDPTQKAQWGTKKTPYEGTNETGVTQAGIKLTPVFRPPTVEDFMSQYGEQLKGKLGATYGGPSGLVGQSGEDYASQKMYQDALLAKQKAERTAGLAGTSEGQQQLIQRAVNPNSLMKVGKGAYALDQALLSSDPEAYKTLQGAAATSGSLATKLQALEDLAVQKVKEGQDITDATRSAYQEEFQLGREEKELEPRFETHKTAAQRAYDEAVRRAEYAKEQAAQQRKTVDYTPFLTKEPLNLFQRSETLKPEEAARLQALAQLTQDITGRDRSIYDPALAGGYTRYFDPNTYFDAVAYQKAVNEAQAAAEPPPPPPPQHQGTLDKVVSGIGGAIPYVAPVAAGGTAAAASAGKSVVNTVKKIFCFHPLTHIEMADGIHLPIGEIEIGDVTAIGGKVTSVIKHAFDGNMFVYPCGMDDILVTGSHAVLENGKWIRVEDSKIARELPRDRFPFETVYSLNTENHRLLIEGTVFADDVEVDNGEDMNMKECLDALNEQEKDNLLINNMGEVGNEL